MPKFEFKLQSLLDLKKKIEDSLKNDFGKAIQKLEHEKEVMLLFEVERDDCMDLITGSSGKGVTIEKLKDYNAYLVRIREKIIAQKENIIYAQENADKIRGELVRAVQERKMLEKLREKKYGEYQKEQIKADQKNMDEVVSFNYTDRIAGEQYG